MATDIGQLSAGGTSLNMLWYSTITHVVTYGSSSLSRRQLEVALWARAQWAIVCVQRLHYYANLVFSPVLEQQLELQDFENYGLTQ